MKTRYLLKALPLLLLCGLASEKRPRVKILLVEDDHALRVIHRDYFESDGWEVIAALDGEEGLRLAFEERIDFILLDLMPAKVDGYEICTVLRREKIATPILMLTAKGKSKTWCMDLS